jgi:hypothetical protein
MFHPWWGRGYYGAGFGGRVNMANVNIYNSYRNARVLNGVSGVSAANFRGGQFGGIVHASGEQLRSAGAVRGEMIGPSSANLRYSDRAAGFAPRGGGASSFFTHQQPSAVQHMAVTQGFRGAGREAAPNRNAGGTQFGAGRNGAQSAARPEQNGAGGGGWNRFGTPAAQPGNSYRGSQGTAMQNSRPGQSSSGNGWRGFGESSNGGNSTGRGSQTPAGVQGNRGYNNTPTRQSAPSYSAPRSAAPSYNAPRSSPGSSGARPSGGGGGRPSGGGGHSSGGGHHR